MVAATYDAAMIRVFADEGGYTNDPVDPGGATNWGITIFDARKYWKPNADANDVRNMPKSVASDIYRKHYANPMRYDDLPAGFDYSVLDAAINSGVGRAPQWAAKSLGISAKTINDVVAPANAAADKVSLIQKYWAVRLSFLHGLKTWSHFGGGWGRRCANGEAAAVRMWLSAGAKLSGADAKARMDQEANKAKTNSKNAGTGAATAGTGTTIGAPAVDPSHLSLGGKIALGIVIAGAVVLVVYLVRLAIIHKQRADAYAA
jgi:lysozyme family protein